jgi:hypothetical protein
MLKFEYRELGNDGDSEAFEAWLMVVQHKLDYEAEVVEPKRGDEVIVSWRTDNYEELYRCEGKVSRTQFNLTIKSQISILVAQRLKDPDMPGLISVGLLPFFEFSCQPISLNSLITTMDGVLHNNNNGVNKEARERICSVLMGRINFQPIRRKSLRVVSESRISHAASQMDSSQKKAFCELLDKPFSIVIGPPGSGKSFMAATFCNMCIEGGEIILEIGMPPAAVRQLFA